MLCYTSIRPTSPSEIQEKYVMLHLYLPHFPERNSGKVCYVTFLYAPLPRARFRRTSRQCNLYSQKRLWRSKNLKAVQFVPPKRFWRNKNLKAVQFLPPKTISSWIPAGSSWIPAGFQLDPTKNHPKNVFGAVRTSRQCNLYHQQRFWRSKNLKAVQFVPPKTFLAQ